MKHLFPSFSLAQPWFFWQARQQNKPEEDLFVCVTMPFKTINLPHLQMRISYSLWDEGTHEMAPIVHLATTNSVRVARLCIQPRTEAAKQGPWSKTKETILVDPPLVDHSINDWGQRWRRQTGGKQQDPWKSSAPDPSKWWWGGLETGPTPGITQPLTSPKCSRCGGHKICMVGTKQADLALEQQTGEWPAADTASLTEPAQPSSCWQSSGGQSYGDTG